MSCGRPVGVRFFFSALARIRTDRLIRVQLRAALRLQSEAASPRIHAAVRIRGSDALKTTPVRIKQEINGRPYVIEVRPVGHSRWRAEVARDRGAMTSLMPFYGATPAAAAELLTVWLSRAAGPRQVK